MIKRKSKSLVRRAESDARLRRTGIVDLYLNDGQCDSCPVRAKCEFYKAGSNKCRLVELACSQVIDKASKSPVVKELDNLAVRNLAAVYAGIVFSERFFAVYGITRVKNKEQVVFTELYRDYLKLIKQFDEALSNFGMTPMGRYKFTNQGTQQDLGGKNSLERYIESKVVNQALDEAHPPKIKKTRAKGAS